MILYYVYIYIYTHTYTYNICEAMAAAKEEQLEAGKAKLDEMEAHTTNRVK